MHLSLAQIGATLMALVPWLIVPFGPVIVVLVPTLLLPFGLVIVVLSPTLLLPFGLVIVVLVPLMAIATLWSHRSCLFPKLVLLTSGCWVGPIGL